MAWSTLKYSLKDVDAAGDALVASGKSGPSEDVLDIVGNWRSCHAFPLNTLQMALRRKTAQFDKNPLVAQRVKRLPAIAHKLARLKRLKLSELQDIGGCRAVLSNVNRVRAVRKALQESNMRHQVHTENDYIAAPKKSGYRSLHVVFTYLSDRNEEHNGRKIEMQIRTRLQHAWATAVETVGMFSSQYLKSSQGDQQWLRFFALMGSVLSLREKGSIVPDTPASPTELKAELRSVANALDARRRLITYGEALKVVGGTINAATRGGFFLLQLHAAAAKLEIRAFRRRELDFAQSEYLRVERESLGKDPGVEAVLVRVDSVAALSNAYPNYYLDTRRFVDALDEAMGK